MYAVPAGQPKIEMDELFVLPSSVPARATAATPTPFVLAATHGIGVGVVADWTHAAGATAIILVSKSIRVFGSTVKTATDSADSRCCSS